MTNTQTPRRTTAYSRALIVLALVLAALAFGMGTASTASASTPTPVPTCGSDAECSAMNPGPDGEGYGTSWAKAVAYVYGAPVVDPMDPMTDGPLYPLDVSSPALEELRVAVIDAGYSGRDDGSDNVLYVPMWMVLDVPGGTWTTTPWGPARCVDWATTGAECSGGEYIPGWPEFLGWDAL